MMSRKIYLSLLSLVMATLLFVTVSYAWASLSLINNVTGLNLSATVGDELQLSVDGVNYFTKLPASEIENIFNEVRLKDITTVNGIDFSTNPYKGASEPIANKDYISFELWIRSSRPEKHVFLYNNINDQVSYEKTDQLGTFAVSKGTLWVAKHSFFNGPTTNDLVKMGTLGKYHASEAIRISIIELNNDMNPMDDREESALSRFIYDPSENKERGFGKLFGSYSYYFQMAGYYMPVPTEFPKTSYRLSEMDPRNPYQAADNESLIATLQETEEVDDKGRPYYVSKIRINIWLEGWDPDAFDAITGDRIKIQLQFKSAHKAPKMD